MKAFISFGPFMIFLSASLLLNAEDLAHTSSSISGWSVGSGLQWRKLGGTRFSPDVRSSDLRRADLDTGPADSVANRIYDDGFVNISPATALTGRTSDFGFTAASTIEGDNLILTRNGEIAIERSGTISDGDETELSPYIELSYHSSVREYLEVGFTLNFSFLGFDSSVSQSLAQSSLTTRDTFALGGVVLPDAPFTGSGTIGASGAPLIPNIPVSREELVSVNGSQTASFNSETNLYSLAFGPDVRWSPREGIYLGLSSGVVLNIASWEASRDVPFVNPINNTVSNRVTRNSGNDVLWGFYTKAVIGVDISENWAIEGFYRYDLNQDVSERLGPGSFETDLTGWSAGVGLRYSL